MLTIYHILIYIHVLAVTVWLGGGIVMEVIGLRLGHNPAREELNSFFSILHYVGPRLFMPAALVTILSGLTMVFMGGASFTDLWIIIAIVGVALNMAFGGAQIGRLSNKMYALLQANGDQQEIARLGRKIKTATYIDLAILLIVLLDMVMKFTL